MHIQGTFIFIFVLLTLHTVRNEPDRIFKHILVFNGNNSMKHMYQLGDHAVINMKPFTDTSYLPPPEYVDKFKDEVSRRGPASVERMQHTLHSEEDNWEGVEEGSPEDKLLAGCMKNFKAASQESKSSYATFYENGWVVSACCHSFILWFSNMIRSREM